METGKLLDTESGGRTTPLDPSQAGGAGGSPTAWPLLTPACPPVPCLAPPGGNPGAGGCLTEKGRPLRGHFAAQPWEGGGDGELWGVSAHGADGHSRARILRMPKAHQWQKWGPGETQADMQVLQLLFRCPTSHVCACVHMEWAGGLRTAGAGGALWWGRDLRPQDWDAHPGPVLLPSARSPAEGAAKGAGVPVGRGGAWPARSGVTLLSTRPPLGHSVGPCSRQGQKAWSPGPHRASRGRALHPAPQHTPVRPLGCEVTAYVHCQPQVCNVLVGRGLPSCGRRPSLSWPHSHEHMCLQANCSLCPENV